MANIGQQGSYLPDAIAFHHINITAYTNDNAVIDLVTSYKLFD